MSPKRLFVLLLIMAGLAAAGYAVVEKVQHDHVRGILISMQDAEKNTTYTATLTRRGKWGSKEFSMTMKVYHQAPDKRAMEFLKATSDGKEITDPKEWRDRRGGWDRKKQDPEGIKGDHRHDRRDGWDRKKQDPEGKKGDHRRGGPSRYRSGRRGGPRGRKPSITDVDLLLRNYEVSIEGTESVAGRPCHRITVSPRYPGRPSCKLWVDREKSLLLRYESPDRKFQYETVEYDPAIDPKVFERKRRWSKGPPSFSYVRKEVSLAEAKELVSFPVAQPTWLPKGFQFRKATYRKWGSRETLYLSYTDGLATISIFESAEGTEWGRSWSWLSKKKDGTTQAGRYRRGNMTMLTVPLDGVIVTAVSSIPEEELKDLLSSLEIKP